MSVRDILYFFPATLIFMMGSVFSIYDGFAKKNKEYFWLSATEKKIIDNSNRYSFEDIFYRFLVPVFCVWYLILILNLLGFFKVKLIVNISEYDSIMDAINMALACITLLSLITTIKKEFYLTITIKDVMRTYHIGQRLITCWIISFSMFAIKLILNFFLQNWLVLRVLNVLIFSMFLIFIYNLLLLGYRIIVLVIYDSLKEFEGLKALRYKVAADYRVEKNIEYTRNGIEKNILFLIIEMEKNKNCISDIYNEMECVEYNSIMLLGRKSKKFKLYGTVLVIVFCIIFYTIIISYFFEELKNDYPIMIISILLTLLITCSFGYFGKWNIFVANRDYWSFFYKNAERERKVKIVGCSFIPNYSKRYEFIGSIEDILGFYKILLHSNKMCEERTMIIEEIEKTQINEQIKKTILLLCYYLDYEKYAMDSKNEKMKKMFRLEESKKKFMEQITKDSFEYQFADTILMHLYKECKREKDGNEIPEKLCNPLFEEFVELYGKKTNSENETNGDANENKEVLEERNNTVNTKKCRALTKSWDKGYSVGIERGIIALIEMCREFGLNEEETKSMLIEKFNIAPQNAEIYMLEYWQ